MRFFSQIAKLIFAYYLARFVGNLILTNNYILIGVLFVGFIYLFFSSWNLKFILLSFIVFVPLIFPYPIGPFGKWIEIIAPSLCFFFILEILSKKQSLLSKKASIFFVAIGVLSLWSVVDYIKHPVLGQLTFGAEKGGLRQYYTIFTGITVFLCSFWFFKYKELNVRKWFFLLLIVSLVLGYLQLIRFFRDLGFLTTILDFVGGPFVSIGSPGEAYYRIGGLASMAGLGISTLLSLFHKKRWDIFFIILLIGYLVLVFFGGSRMSALGIVTGIIVYITLINKKYFLPFIFFLLICVGIFISAGILPDRTGQIKRFTSVIEVSPLSFYGRYYASLYMWEIFKKNPIFGKGISHLEGIEEEFFIRHPEAQEEYYRQHIESQLAAGGHGAYFSILSIFGIGGFFWLIVMLFGGMYYAYRIFKRSDKFQDDAQLALFAFIYLIMLSIFSLTGGEGYNNMKLWFISGMIAGIISKE